MSYPMDRIACPDCGEDCWRDEVDIGVGTMFGPWRCTCCGWYEERDNRLLDLDAVMDAKEAT